MTSKFLACHPFIADAEGGYVDHKDDKGGATNHGISSRFLKSAFEDYEEWFNSIGVYGTTKNDIKMMTKEQAKQIYFKFFWLAKFEELETAIAYCYYDMNVNHGLGLATRIMQRAFNSLDIRNSLDVDGKLGINTMTALNMTDTVEMIDAVYEERCKTFRAIVADDISQERFINGWLNRAIKMQKNAQGLM